MKKVLVIFLTALLLTTNIIKADEETYKLAIIENNNYQIIDEYKSFSSAFNAFDKLKDKYDNLLIINNDKVMRMEYGVVEFKTDNGCSYITSFRTDNDEYRSINGCYGIDGEYITTTKNGNVYFKISGENGLISLDKVKLRPLDNLNVRTSAYVVRDGILYHEVKSQLEADYISWMIPLGKAISLLKEGNSYYSYDGHYFYDDFKVMVDDERDEIRENAINAKEPFYNYYQYLPHRSLTSYDEKELSSYFKNELMIDSRLRSYMDMDGDEVSDAFNESQYADVIPYFFAYQNIYGANALMMLALSIQESSYGKSYSSYARNNLFGHAAYDNDVERNTSRYLSVARSIYSHAKYYISHAYSSPNSSSYAGSFFGDKASGMNVKYSDDPYWGEKTASYYYRLDQALGLKDENAYSLAFINDGKVRVFKDNQEKSLLFEIISDGPYSFIVLKEENGYYKVQIDPPIDDTYIYSFKDCVGYIRKDNVTIINNDILEKEYVDIVFNANGGNYDGKDKLVLQVEKGKIPTPLTPIKNGYLFTSYDHKLLPAEEGQEYTAKYKEILDFKIRDFPSTVESGKMVDLSSSYLEVTTIDGKKYLEEMNSDYIRDYQINSIGEKEITIAYAGITKNIKIEFLENDKKIDEELRNDISKLINDYQSSSKYNLDELNNLKKSLKKNKDYILDGATIRILDEISLKEIDDKVDYVIEDSKNLDLAISGFGLSLDINEEDYEDGFLKNTYLLKSGSISARDEWRFTSIAEKYGYVPTNSFSLNFYRNFKKIKPSLMYGISIAVDSKSDVYTIFYLDKNDNVYKLPTTRTSSYLQFIAPGDGSFMVMKKKSDDTYDIKDITENVNIHNDKNSHLALYFKILFLIFFFILDLIMLLNEKRLTNIINKTEYNYKKSLK